MTRPADRSRDRSFPGPFPSWLASDRSDGEAAEAAKRRAAVKAERFKMLAGGTQLIAVAVLGASIVAPTFSAAQHFDPLIAAGGGFSAGMIELIAWLLMGYGVPQVETPRQEDADNA